MKTEQYSSHRPIPLPTVSYDPHTNIYHSSLGTLHSATHGRQRREQRKIHKVDLNKARRYGIRENARRGRLKYTFGGVTFIYDPVRNKEVTSYRSFRLRGTPGSLSSEIIHLTKKAPYDSPQAIAQHETLTATLAARHELWHSHTVLVVDMSGSMRTDDVAGARARSEAVWGVLARDFVQIPLIHRISSSSDVVSIILMREGAEVVVHCEPLDWVLYNRLVHFREWTTQRPEGPGNYLPSLAKAEELLKLNRSATCALSLYFVSDGKPSDNLPRQVFRDRVGMIATTLGQRLTTSFVGIASPDEDFSVLKDMSEECKAYGCKSMFHLPSLHTSSLSSTITSLVSSMTDSKLSLSGLRQSKRHNPVKLNIVRERENEPEDIDLTNEWLVYSDDSTRNRHVKHIWAWSRELDNIVPVVDPRCVFCSKLVVVTHSPIKNESSSSVPFRGSECPQCKACYFCAHCEYRKHEHIGNLDTCAPLASIPGGALSRKTFPSFSVAIKQKVIGEGVERIASRFRFVDEQGFIGTHMVVKETRLDEAFAFQNENPRLDLPVHQRDFAARMGFHRSFLRCQATSQSFAAAFNAILDGLPSYFEDRGTEIVLDVPRIRFVDQFLVALEDDGNDRVVLVEEFLFGKYTKFNSNNGYVRGRRKPQMSLEPILEDPEEALNMALHSPRHGIHIDHGTRYYRNDTHYSGLQEEPGEVRSYEPSPACNFHSIREEDIPQAFSHFTFEKSGGQIIVVDLQGVLGYNKRGGREFAFTDPAIHSSRSMVIGEGGFGRTDRHEKGIKAFFSTHQCTDACRLFGLRERRNTR